MKVSSIDNSTSFANKTRVISKESIRLASQKLMRDGVNPEHIGLDANGNKYAILNVNGQKSYISIEKIREACKKAMRDLFLFS